MNNQLRGNMLYLYFLLSLTTTIWLFSQLDWLNWYIKLRATTTFQLIHSIYRYAEFVLCPFVFGLWFRSTSNGKWSQEEGNKKASEDFDILLGTSLSLVQT